MELIDRQAALEAFEWADADVCEADEFGSSWGFGYKNIKDVLNKLPTIDPESLRPKGEWYWLAYDANPKIGNWHCRRCNCIPKSHQKEDFCPNCGADMRGESE